jgi:hypothetical protein
MSKFSELSRPGKCDVCGKETDVVVCASSMGATSYAYCEDCLNKGLEPYDAMVSYIACAGRFPDDINSTYQEHCRNILNELNISEDKFIADVDKCSLELYEDFAKWCEENCDEM